MTCLQTPSLTKGPFYPLWNFWLKTTYVKRSKRRSIRLSDLFSKPFKINLNIGFKKTSFVKYIDEKLEFIFLTFSKIDKADGLQLVYRLFYIEFGNGLKTEGKYFKIKHFVIKHLNFHAVGMDSWIPYFSQKTEHCH